MFLGSDFQLYTSFLNTLVDRLAGGCFTLSNWGTSSHDVREQPVSSWSLEGDGNMRIFRRSSPNPTTGFSDRGPAKYFHGRREILSSFHELLLHANQNRGGTTFLIQGAPGAGKTALLAE